MGFALGRTEAAGKVRSASVSLLPLLISIETSLKCVLKCGSSDAALSRVDLPR
jgi:hypothetical protein